MSSSVTQRVGLAGGIVRWRGGAAGTVEVWGMFRGVEVIVVGFGVLLLECGVLVDVCGGVGNRVE